MVSVCMLSYGHEKVISQAIEGVLMQVCDCEVELIIANDCSPDNTSAIVNQLMENHPNGKWIRYTNHAANIGMVENFHYALKQAKGEYVAFCDGDDFWTDSSKLQKQLDIFKNDQDVALVHTDYSIFKEVDESYLQSVNDSKHIPTNNVYNELLHSNFIATLTVMVKTNVLRQAANSIGTVLSKCPMVDYPLWLYVSSNYKVAYLEQSTATYRYSPSSASHSESLTKNLKFLQGIFTVRKYFVNRVKNVPLSITIKIYKSFYTESGLYILKKLKQKLYAQPG